MVKTASCFAQVLSLVNRADFERAVRRHEAEKWTKGFSCWDQFVAMLFCQMGGAHSLREICGGLVTALGKLVHLGMKEAPSRSTLAYANEHRPWQVYQDVFEGLLGRCGRRQPEAPEIPVQESAPEPRFDGDRVVPGFVRLGAVPPDQGRDQAAPATGPSGIPAVLGAGDRGPHARSEGGARAFVRAGDDHRPGRRVQRLRAPVPLARRGRVLRHAPEGQPALRGRLHAGGPGAVERAPRRDHRG